MGVTAIGFAEVTWQWRRAQHHFRVSEVNLQEANAQRARAERNLVEADRQRNRAEQNFERARSTVNRFLRQVPNHELLRKPGLEQIKADLQALACEYYEQLAADNADDPHVQLELGQAALFAVGCALGECVKLLDELPAASTVDSLAERERLSGEAVATLQAAVEAGFADQAALRTAPQLDALRPRADFQRLLVQMSRSPTGVDPPRGTGIQRRRPEPRSARCVVGPEETSDHFFLS